jgi:hypothetical protein
MGLKCSASQLVQQILGMDWLGQNLEFIAPATRFFKQVSGGGLP